MARYAEKRHLPFTPQQLFDLVADVERYPDFLPWFAAAAITRREANMVWVDMVVGTSFIRRHFASKATLDRPHRIDVVNQDDLFDHYQQTWTFQPGKDGGTMVEFQVEYVFRSRALQLLMGAFLEEAAKSMVNAFNRRARQIYSRNDQIPVMNKAERRHP
jgi:coenzyme Q-binding protein COQ10